MSLIISVGKWGGFYWHRGYSWRICLGWLAVTVIPRDVDDVLIDAYNQHSLTV